MEDELRSSHDHLFLLFRVYLLFLFCCTLLCFGLVSEGCNLQVVDIAEVQLEIYLLMLKTHPRQHLFVANFLSCFPRAILLKQISIITFSSQIYIFVFYLYLMLFYTKSISWLKFLTYFESMLLQSHRPKDCLLIPFETRSLRLLFRVSQCFISLLRAIYR